MITIWTTSDSIQAHKSQLNKETVGHYGGMYMGIVEKGCGNYE